MLISGSKTLPFSGWYWFHRYRHFLQTQWYIETLIKWLFMNIVPLTSQSLIRIEFSLVSHCGHIWGSSLIIPKSTNHPTNKLIVGIRGQISPPCGAITPKVCTTKVCTIFGYKRINMIRYEKKSPTIKWGFSGERNGIYSRVGVERFELPTSHKQKTPRMWGLMEI